MEIKTLTLNVCIVIQPRRNGVTLIAAEYVHWHDGWIVGPLVCISFSLEHLWNPSWLSHQCGIWGDYFWIYLTISRRLDLSESPKMFYNASWPGNFWIRCVPAACVPQVCTFLAPDDVLCAFFQLSLALHSVWKYTQFVPAGNFLEIQP